MGQRLNIEITKAGTPLANSYYHWSAYTASAANLADDVIDKYFELLGDDPNMKDTQNPVMLAIKLLQATGSGANDACQENVLSMKREVDDAIANGGLKRCPCCGRPWVGVATECPECHAKASFWKDIDELIKPCSDRNNGLLGIVEDDMEKTRNWEEGRVTIDIAEETVNFEVLFWMDDEEEQDPDFAVDENDLVEVNLDFSHIPFDRFHDFAEVVGNYPAGLIDCSGERYTLIA